jgi:hypothetical protein
MPNNTIKVYISGKITGLCLEQARSNFADAELQLLCQGYEPVNPMTLPHNHAGEWEDYMALDIAELTKCDAIYMLPDWQESNGARLELKIAKHLNKQIIYDKTT